MSDTFDFVSKHFGMEASGLKVEIPEPLRVLTMPVLREAPADVRRRGETWFEVVEGVVDTVELPKLLSFRYLIKSRTRNVLECVDMMGNVLRVTLGPRGE